MGDSRNFDIKEQDGGLLGESSVELHEHGGGDYAMSGDDAKKFIRNRHRMEIESESEYGITFVDKKTGEKVFAGREESSIPGLIAARSS